MYFDRWDICEAYYIYAVEYMNGQNSPEMRVLYRLHKMGYKPAGFHGGYDSLSENGKAIYQSLVQRYV
jgi:hypothetical protein